MSDSIPQAPPNPDQDQTLDKKPGDIEENQILEAIKASWSYGYNNDIGILNLSINEQRKMFLCSSHVAIVQDFEKNEQKLLQGHRNTISCVTVSEEKRWLITADYGNDSTIIVWDLATCTPVQTYFNTHEQGTLAVAISNDSKFIATLSADFPQVLAIWEWTTDSENPICTAELAHSNGLQTHICFNSSNNHQLVSNSATQTIFYQWDFTDGFEYFTPELNDNTFNKPVGKCTQSIFQLNQKNALSATTLGNLVVWEKIENSTHECDKKAFKLFKFQERSINVLKNLNELIVIGDADGQIKFIDQNLHVVAWFRHFKLGPISSISFTHFTKDFKMPVYAEEPDTDATVSQKKFICKDFLLSSTSAKIAYVSNSCKKIKVLCTGSDSSVNALTCHPQQAKLAFGNSHGQIQLWDYENQIMLSTRAFLKSEQQEITCLQYDSKGNYVAVGFKNGNLQLIDAISLHDCLKAPFSYAHSPITHIEFSHDSNYLATAESDHTISVYIKNYNKDASELYAILGRYKSHYKPIVGLLFGLTLDTNETRLLSLGQDRVLVEYDLQKSTFDSLLIKKSTRIEQYAMPLGMLWYPPITKESFILTFNDQWKYKLFNSSTIMCRKTLLGPTFGSLLKKSIVLPSKSDQTKNRYLAYITHDKVGLQKLPLTGNPFDSIATFSHPDGVANLVSSHDGKYLFTAGGLNKNVFMWKINFQCLDAQASLGGEDLTPFYGLIEGGRDGLFFKEMKELFYYSQLRHQGIQSNDERKITKSIPLSEIPFLMRGLGFYPTEQEIDDMINEVKFSRFVDTNEYVDAIDLNELIKLYINHRPVFGLDPYEIYNSFKFLSESKNETISRSKFLDMLQNVGEHLTEYELADCISNLLHLNCAVDELSTEDVVKVVETNLPNRINIDTFMSHLMGIPKENFEQILSSWEEIRQANSIMKSYRASNTQMQVNNRGTSAHFESEQSFMHEIQSNVSEDD